MFFEFHHLLFPLSWFFLNATPFEYTMISFDPLYDSDIIVQYLADFHTTTPPFLRKNSNYIGKSNLVI